MSSANNQSLVILPWQKAILISSKIAFSIFIAMALAKLTWLIIAPVELVLAEPNRSTSAQAGNDSALYGIADWHLFGDLDAKPEVAEEKVDAPVTRLRLELLGVLSGPTAEESSAIIAPKGGKGSFYKVGQKIQGRTKLSAVYDDRVVLDTLGKLETLKFELRKTVGFQANQAPPAKTKNTSRARGSLEKRLRGQRSVSGFVDVINAELDDPKYLLKELGLATNEGGGYKIAKSGSMLTGLGLKPGDVILSVNGQSLGDINSDKALIEDVTSSGKARIEVQRGNRRFVVNHNIQR